MSYLRGFLPWIAFAVVSSFGWQWGALSGLVLGAALLGQGRRAAIPMDAQILEVSTIVYFAALTAFAFIAPDSPLAHYVGGLSMAWLALTAWGTVAARRPFTLGIAKQQTPPELWETPIFRRVNVVITSAWGVAFTVTAVALAAVSAANLGAAVSIPVQVAGFAVAAVFTSRYPQRVRARFAAQEG